MVKWLSVNINESYMLSWTLHANFTFTTNNKALQTLWQPHSSYRFVHSLCRVQTNWKSLRSKTVSLDEGNGIVSFLECINIDEVNTQMTQRCLFLLVYVARERGLLQTYLLRHRVPPVYGNDSQPRLCQQVCLLLEVMSLRVKQQQRSRQYFIK